MDLLETVKSLSEGTKIRVVLMDDSVLIGKYETYTSAITNDPEIASFDLETDEGIYEIYENEIKSVEPV